MQVEGCERHGPGVKPVIANIRRLLDRFREINGKIIHVQSVRTKDHPEFTVFGRPYGLLLGSLGADFIEELKPLPGETIVQKTSHDCFYKTSMEATLEKLDLRPCRDKIVVTGIGSSNWVYHAGDRLAHQKLLQHRAGRLYPRCSPAVPALCPASVPLQRV